MNINFKINNLTFICILIIIVLLSLLISCNNSNSFLEGMTNPPCSFLDDEGNLLEGDYYIKTTGRDYNKGTSDHNTNNQYLTVNRSGNTDTKWINSAHPHPSKADIIKGYRNDHSNWVFSDSSSGSETLWNIKYVDKNLKSLGYYITVKKESPNQLLSRPPDDMEDWGLASWSHYGAARDGESSYVAIIKDIDDRKYWMNWKIENVDGNDFKILTNPTTHQKNTIKFSDNNWGLSSWNDKIYDTYIDKNSSIVATYEGSYWPQLWELIPVHDHKDKNTQPATTGGAATASGGAAAASGGAAAASGGAATASGGAAAASGGAVAASGGAVASSSSTNKNAINVNVDSNISGSTPSTTNTNNTTNVLNSGGASGQLFNNPALLLQQPSNSILSSNPSLMDNMSAGFNSLFGGDGFNSTLTMNNLTDLNTYSSTPSTMFTTSDGRQGLATTQNTINGIPSSQIPQGQEDLYILKSQVVPPVCPACPPVIVDKNTLNQDCPPCPPCARCPEPSFECKKVPNFNLGPQNTFLPRPVLNDFSTFGM